MAVETKGLWASQRFIWSIRGMHCPVANKGWTKSLLHSLGQEESPRNFDMSICLWTCCVMTTEVRHEPDVSRERAPCKADLKALLESADLPWSWICAVVCIYSPARAVQAAPQWLHPAPSSFGSISKSPAPKSWNEVHPAQESLTGWTCACSNLGKNCTEMYLYPAHGCFWSYWWHSPWGSQQHWLLIDQEPHGYNWRAGKCDNHKRSEGNLSHQHCQSPSKDTHHLQDLPLNMDKLCILPMGDIKFQGNLANKYSH